MFTLGLALGGLGACLLPLSMMTLATTVDKAEKIERRLQF